MAEDIKQESQHFPADTIIREHAPHIFIDGFWGIAVIDGVARVHLYRLHYRLDTGAVSKEIVATISIPASSLENVLDSLSDFIKKQKASKQGG
jgi:hypothetical protein